MTELEALLKVIVDGQAWLYAQMNAILSGNSGIPIGEGMFENWEDDWKTQTTDLVKELMDTKNLPEVILGDIEAGPDE